MDEDATDAPVSRRQFMTAVTGAAAAGTAGVAGAQEEETTGEGGGGGGGGATEEVVVGPGGDLVYEPADLEIAVGTTVNFVWESDNHNIVVENQPDDANWEGTEGEASVTYDTGHEYSHTFETTGTYDYYCQPHVGAGMEASIEVVESLDTGGSTGPVLPESAKTLAVATTAAMLSVLSLAYFFMRYGGDFETPE
ncbi:halocyanin [Halorubellus sp. JP-L1]|uniref:plastocyanin/azurin family copper-binding protein n=1 Tax=Halorubellus sp. JP-L1 TaxID=2715753 RepID=UPI001408E529|nr:plastocyanin/azurin family copper-binding protein [Halorubellus sp. JP-L1]NHN42320.1 halocyanin [Halorubellus sp. JP-L1]